MMRYHAETCQFDWINEVELQVPVVSMVARATGVDIKAFCVQTSAIQCYTMRPDQMFGPPNKAKNSEKNSENISEKISDKNSEKISEKISENPTVIDQTIEPTETKNKVGTKNKVETKKVDIPSTPLAIPLLSVVTRKEEEVTTQKPKEKKQLSKLSPNSRAASVMATLGITTGTTTTTQQLLSPNELLRSISPSPPPPPIQQPTTPTSPRGQFEEIDDTVGGNNDDDDNNNDDDNDDDESRSRNASTDGTLLYLLEQGYTNEQAKRGEVFLNQLRNDSDLGATTASTTTTTTTPTTLAPATLTPANLTLLTSKVTSSVRAPVLAAFRSTMEEVVLPSFESAVSEMFTQVSHTMKEGMKEYSKQYVNNKMSKTVDLKLKQMNAKIDKLTQLTKTVEALAASVKQLAQATELAVAQAERAPPQAPQPPQQEDSATAKSPVAKPTTEQLKQQIDVELQNKQIQRAFWVALNEGNYELVKWTCSKLSPDQVVGEGKREHYFFVCLEKAEYIFVF